MPYTMFYAWIYLFHVVLVSNLQVSMLSMIMAWFACSMLLCLCPCQSHACMLGFAFSHAFMFISTCLDVYLHVYMHASMPICLDLCFHMLVCLGLLLYMLYAISLVRSICLHASCHVYVPFITSSCVLAYWFGLDLDPMVFVIVHTPRPTSKDLDHLICMSMLACFYALCLC